MIEHVPSTTTQKFAIKAAKQQFKKKSRTKRGNSDVAT